MADGTYRVTGGAPSPDPARVVEAAANLDPAAPEDFGQPACAIIIDRLDQALMVINTRDAADPVARLVRARSMLDDLSPATLEPRRGLAGLFDSRGRRLKQFRSHFNDITVALTEITGSLSNRAGNATRQGATLEGIWEDLRTAVSDLDVHLVAATDRPEPESEPPSPLAVRIDGLTACRTAGLGALPLIRSIQNIEARIAGSLILCNSAVDAWRDGWAISLGLGGRRPKRVRPDPARLQPLRDALLGRIDSAISELGSVEPRRTRLSERLEDLRRAT